MSHGSGLLSGTPGLHSPLGATVWLTGLPSAGKTTLAEFCAGMLRGRGRSVEVLDGDALRSRLSPDLGFSAEERNTHVRRVGFVANLLAGHGVVVLVAVIAPFAAGRAAVRELHAGSGTTYLEVHVATSTSVCMARDVKGLYAAHRAGSVQRLTGIDDPYEVPADPELRLDAGVLSPAQCASQILRELTRRAAL